VGSAQGRGHAPALFSAQDHGGSRTISIAALLVSELKRWKLRCPSSQKELVFPSIEGKPICRDWLLRVAFYPTLVRARLRRVTFHTRHSCASAMIAVGAPVTEFQHRLGHANPAITLQVYSHFFKHAERGSRARQPTDSPMTSWRRPRSARSPGNSKIVGTQWALTGLRWLRRSP
jgi:integrase